MTVDGKPCVCGPDWTCLWHYGEAKRDARRKGERPYRKGRRGRTPRRDG